MIGRWGFLHLVYGLRLIVCVVVSWLGSRAYRVLAMGKRKLQKKKKQQQQQTVN